jgi:hypothetical protein
VVIRSSDELLPCSAEEPLGEDEVERHRLRLR